MRILFASTGGAGHFTPLIPWINESLHRGHEVLVVGPMGLAPTVEPWSFPPRVGATPPAEEVAEIAIFGWATVLLSVKRAPCRWRPRRCMPSVLPLINGSPIRSTSRCSPRCWTNHRSLIPGGTGCPLGEHAGGGLPDWWPGNSVPLVYVTFGTVAPAMPGMVSLYRAVLDAVAGLPVRVLLTVGEQS